MDFLDNIKKGYSNYSRGLNEAALRRSPKKTLWESNQITQHTFNRKFCLLRSGTPCIESIKTNFCHKKKKKNK